MSARIPFRVAAGAAPFVPFAPWLRRWPAGNSWPDVEALDAAAREAALALPDGRPLRFVPAPTKRSSALAYERRVAERGEIETRRRDPHDVANALAWLAFPRTKAALNRRHVEAVAAGSPAARGRVRDAATLLDESGLLFACADDGLVAGLRAHRWRETFGERRDDVRRRVCAYAIGHGLVVKLLAPFPSLTAKALPIPLAADALPEGVAGVAAVDRAAAGLVAAAGFDVTSLCPLPVAALPGWPGDDGRTGRFDDLAVYRPLRPARTASASTPATTAGSSAGLAASASAPSSSSVLP